MFSLGCNASTLEEGLKFSLKGKIKQGISEKKKLLDD